MKKIASGTYAETSASLNNRLKELLLVYFCYENRRKESSMMQNTREREREDREEWRVTFSWDYRLRMVN